MIRTVILAALCAVLFASNADARPRHPLPIKERAGCSDPVMRPCGGRLKIEPSFRHHPKHLKRLSNRRKAGGFGTTPLSRRERVPPALRRVMAEGAGRVVGGRPAGCPRRYCGCGASLYIFGKIIPSLNLAANWLRFPRAEPAPGMVAARRGHVFVLKRHIRGKVWRVFDANSGGGKTRLHNRSIAGFTIVDPSGA